jgi:hypothetical protein
MVEQGMDRRRQQLRAGLLALILLFPGGFLRSQEAGEEDGFLEIQFGSSPDTPAVNSPWSVFILVNHPVPSEVNIKPPPFPSSLFLESIKSEARVIARMVPEGTEEAQNERWTRVEFLFIPQRADSFTLEPFEVIVPGRQAVSGRINGLFRSSSSSAVRRYEPRFRWLPPAPSLRPGVKGNISLELTNWDPQKEAPNGFFRGRAPLNAILEESSPSAAGGGTFRYNIGIVPLDAASVTIEAFSFQSETYNLSVPRFVVPVLPAPPIIETVSPVLNPSLDPDEDFTGLPFPGTQAGGSLFLQGTHNRVRDRIRGLWDEGRRVEALAEIRRNERDSLAGPSFTPLRREMEQALALGFTVDENWRPLGVSLLLWVIAGFLTLFSAAVLFVLAPRARIQKKSVTSRSGNGFMTVIVLALAIGLVFILLDIGVSNFLINRRTAGNSAVLNETSAFRVPDPGAAVNTRFSEGQPVMIGDYRGDWCYAESPDGRSGWIPRGAVVVY